MIILYIVKTQTIKRTSLNSTNLKYAKNQSNNQDKSLRLFPVDRKEVELSFSGEKISSDGGLLLLKEIEEQVGIISSLSSALIDQRDQRYISHDINSLLSQRIYQIACGYEDTNDCDSLKSDAIFKICAGRLPDSGADLASQPTMSRLENSVSRSDMYRIAEVIALTFINSYEQEPNVIVVDFDDTDSRVHGGQQLSVFNGYYGEYCYMPLHVYEGISGKLITTVLKPGRRSKGINVLSIFKRVINFVRQYWKNTLIVYRGDGHFSSPETMEWIDKQKNIFFVTGLAGNSVLNTNARLTSNSAKNIFVGRIANKLGHKKVKLYHSFFYKAKSWEKSRRVICKVETSDLGNNIRFIVTNMDQCKAKQLYEEIYCARGKMELYIKEHKTYLKSDRTSCHKFEANQFRLFLHSAAYILIHALQNSALKNTKFANSTMRTIQLKLLKTAAGVKELKTKIKIEFPRSCPIKNIFEKAFRIFEFLRC